MAFPGQEYWSGLSCPPPGDLPDSGIKPASLTSPALAGRFFTTRATWEAPKQLHPNQKKKKQLEYGMKLLNCPHFRQSSMPLYPLASQALDMDCPCGEGRGNKILEEATACS